LRKQGIENPQGHFSTKHECNLQKFDNKDCSSQGQSQSKDIHITALSWFFIMGQSQPQHNASFGECFGKTLT
jgi:hypothetical protein